MEDIKKQIKVDGKNNAYQIPGNWNSLRQKAAEAYVLEPGKYTIELDKDSEGINFWPPQDNMPNQPLVFLLIQNEDGTKNGRFKLLDNDVETSDTYLTLNSYTQKVKIEVLRPKITLYPLIIDVPTTDNRGSVTINIKKN